MGHKRRNNPRHPKPPKPPKNASAGGRAPPATSSTEEHLQEQSNTEPVPDSTDVLPQEQSKTEPVPDSTDVLRQEQSKTEPVLDSTSSDAFITEDDLARVISFVKRNSNFSFWACGFCPETTQCSESYVRHLEQHRGNISSNLQSVVSTEGDARSVDTGNSSWWSKLPEPPKNAAAGGRTRSYVKKRVKGELTTMDTHEAMRMIESQSKWQLDDPVDTAGASVNLESLPSTPVLSSDDQERPLSDDSTDELPQEQSNTEPLDSISYAITDTELESTLNACESAFTNHDISSEHFHIAKKIKDNSVKKQLHFRRMVELATGAIQETERASLILNSNKDAEHIEKESRECIEKGEKVRLDQTRKEFEDRYAKDELPQEQSNTEPLDSISYSITDTELESALNACESAFANHDISSEHFHIAKKIKDNSVKKELHFRRMVELATGAIQETERELLILNSNKDAEHIEKESRECIEKGEKVRLDQNRKEIEDRYAKDAFETAEADAEKNINMSRKKKKKKDLRELKDEKAAGLNKQHVLQEKDGEQVHFPVACHGDHSNADSDISANADTLRQSEELGHRTDLEAQEGRVEENLEYQRGVENEAKQKQLGKQDENTG